MIKPRAEDPTELSRPKTLAATPVPFATTRSKSIKDYGRRGDPSFIEFQEPDKSHAQKRMAWRLPLSTVGIEQ
jgi:hypothetical protein